MTNVYCTVYNTTGLALCSLHTAIIIYSYYSSTPLVSSRTSEAVEESGMQAEIVPPVPKSIEESGIGQAEFIPVLTPVPKSIEENGKAEFILNTKKTVSVR